MRSWRNSCYPLCAKQGMNQGRRARLGIIYYYGYGVPKDVGEALKWYQKTAEQGSVDAQFTLGFLYYEGRGVPQDYVQAHMWFNLAEAQGDKDTQETRDSIAKLMTPAQIAEAQRLAREWKPTTSQK